MGMSNGIGTIAGLICPIAIDNITSDRVSRGWRAGQLEARLEFQDTSSNATEIQENVMQRITKVFLKISYQFYPGVIPF